MTRVCTVCSHPKRREIDAEIAAGTGTKTAIASKYGLNRQAIAYHAEHHLPKALVQAERARDVANANVVIAQVNDLVTHSRSVLDWARENMKLGPRYGRLVLQAVRELRVLSERLAKIAKELQAFEATKESMPTRDVRVDLDRKLDALAGRIQQVRAKERKCPHCGQALPLGEQVEPTAHEGPKPTGPVH